jgi:hypothetical protein
MQRSSTGTNVQQSSLDPSVCVGILPSVADQTKVITVLGWSYRNLEREIETALRDVPPEQNITISYAVSRILGIALQHHALIVLRSD